MTLGPRLLSRIAIVSALIYVLSWGTSWLPNINLIFFLVFSSGFLWGALPGLLVGLVGMWLWTTFNPYGPVVFPLMVAQLVGASISGLVGAAFHRVVRKRTGGVALTGFLVVASLACTIAFYVPVNAVDAWLFQPFWPRFIGGLPWAAVSVGSNAVIFPLLFRVTRRLYERESAPE